MQQYPKKTALKQKIGLVLFGVFLCLVLLEIAMRLAGLAIASLQEQRNRFSIRQGGQYRILCLGESTTAFGGVDSYPYQLEEILNQANCGIKFSVINRGVPGTDTSLIVSQLQDNLDMYSPDMVVTMMGINDHHVTGTVLVSKKTASFFQSFRIYKLIKLLGSHIMNKLQEAGWHTRGESIVEQQGGLSLPLFSGEHKVILEKLSEKDPQAYQEYLEFRECLLRQKAQDGIEVKIKKAVEMNPDNPWAYLGLGRYYWYEGKRNKAEEMFEKAMAIAPQNDWVHLIAANCYTDYVDDYGKSEQISRRAIEINPDNALGYIMLAIIYTKKKEHGKAEELYRKALEADPKNDVTYILFGEYYWHKGEYEKAENTLKKAVEINSPYTKWAYAQLGLCYLKQKKYDKSEENIRSAIAITKENDILYGILYGALAQCYTAQGKYGLAEGYARKAESSRSRYYNPVTEDNYQKLRRIVSSRGIKLICAQYPMHSVEPLKMMFDSTEGVIFVDNDKLFKDAVRNGKYSDYFRDNFGGDFGHCTRRGNRLLAENIAAVIMRECFSR